MRTTSSYGRNNKRRPAARAAKLLAAAALAPLALHAPQAAYAVISEGGFQSVKAHIQAVLEETIGSRNLLVGETVTLELDDIFYQSDNYQYIVTVQNRSVANVRAASGSLVIGGTHQGTTMVDVIAVPHDESALERVHEHFRLNVDANAALDSDHNGYNVQDAVRYIRLHPELSGRPDALRTLLKAAESFVPVPNRAPAAFTDSVPVEVRQHETVMLYLHQLFHDDDGDALTYELVLPSSDLAADVTLETDGRLAITGIAPAESPQLFIVRASDGIAANAQASVTFSLTVTGEAYEPGLEPAANYPLVVLDGDRMTLTDYNLRYVDTNDGGAVTYTLLVPPAYGTLELDNTVLTTGSMFTQSDLEQGRLVYRDDVDTPALADSFQYEASDGRDTVTGSFDISIHAITSRAGAANDGNLHVRPGQQYTVDLEQIFGDYGDHLLYDIDGNLYNLVAEHQLDGSLAAFEAYEYPSGSTAAYELMMSPNGGYSWISHPVTVRLNEGGSRIPDMSFLDSDTLDLHLNEYFDLPGTAWTAEAIDLQNGAHVITRYDDTEKRLELERGPSVGRSTIRVNAHDGHGGYATDQFDIDNGNIPNDIGTVILRYGEQDQSNESYIDVHEIFRDLDYYTVLAVEPEDVLSVIPSASLIVESSGHTSGTITIEGVNIAGESAVVTLQVRTNQAPRSIYHEPPYGEGYHPLIVLQAGSTYTLDMLSPVPIAFDPDDDPLDWYAWVSDGVEHIGLSEADASSRRNIHGLLPGRSVLQVEAQDSHGKYVMIAHDVIVTEGSPISIELDSAPIQIVNLSDALAGLTGEITMEYDDYPDIEMFIEFDPDTKTLTIERDPMLSAHDYMAMTFTDEGEQSVRLSFVIISAKPSL